MDRKDKEYRRKRVERIKRIMVITVIVLILLPTVLCLILFARVHSLSNELEQIKEMKLETLYAAENSKEGRLLAGSSTGSAIVNIGGDYSDSSGSAVTDGDIREGTDTSDVGKDDKNYKGVIYLTFDDGPGANTEKILDILDEYKVKATFFVTGKEDDTSKALYKEIVARGHTIGMHSYSHKYDEIYKSESAFKKDYNKISALLTEVTGEKPWLYRFPGGSSNTVSKVSMKELIKFLKSEDVTYFDWNVMSGDAVPDPPSYKKLAKNVEEGVTEFDESVVLMHDLPEKKSTVKALPYIIEKLSSEGYEFLPITKSTTPVVHKLQ